MNVAELHFAVLVFETSVKAACLVLGYLCDFVIFNEIADEAYFFLGLIGNSRQYGGQLILC